MAWKKKFGRSPRGPSDQALAEVLDKLDQYSGRSPGDNYVETGFKGKMLAVRRAMGPGKEKAACAEPPAGKPALSV